MSYSKTFLEHIEEPRNVGELQPPAVVVEVVNSACGDRIRLSVLVEEGKISSVKMRAFGCAPTLAAASVLTEVVKGYSLDEANVFTTEDLVKVLGVLPRGKKHAADLAVEALHTALSKLIV
ncbi:MAG: iron-sulfur cluster assembly scaffold protein [Blastocatellia bacterium]|nr:iron-sulfur cluster assembly scaffold protein [Blastocatellia bacterium]